MSTGTATEAARDFVDTVNRGGLTATISSGNKSVTIGPKPRAADEAEGGKRLILGGDPDEAIWVPTDGEV